MTSLHPDDYGWQPTSAVEDPTGQCSVHGCAAGVAAVVRRRGDRQRSGWWQGYCAAHALERGVLVDDHGGLRFTPDLASSLIQAGRARVQTSALGAHRS